MKRLFFISDIHGHYEEMVALFRHVGLDLRKDTLVVGGDMINRGPHSFRVIKKIRDMQLKFPANVHVIRGNHEDMIRLFLADKSDMWLTFGGTQLIHELGDVYFPSQKKRYLERVIPLVQQYENGEIKGEEWLIQFLSLFLKGEELMAYVKWVLQLPITFEDQHYVYAHAGIHYPYGEMPQSYDVLWMKKDEFYEMKKSTLLFYTGGKPIVHGHTPDKAVTFDGCRLSCDLGMSVVKNQALGLVELSDKSYYRYEMKTKKITRHSIKKASRRK